MGERKGTNKYYPPDYNPRVGGLNKFVGVHALRERGRKAHLGIIIIRFEMPYNIWCEGCDNHIGMGVRYNAEKTKAGMYYTTPIYEFKMKCHLCDNHFVIKTHPAKLDYEIMSGARRQENRWDPTQNEQIIPEMKETQKRLFDDSMYKLEHGADDANTAENAKPRLASLFNRNENTWSDCYTANQKLRASFRKQSGEFKRSAFIDSALLKKSSLNIKLVPEKDEDIRMASLLSMKLTPMKNIDESTELLRQKIISESSLPTSSFTPAKERRAVKVLQTSVNQNLVLIKNDKRRSKMEKNEKRAKLLKSLVGDYSLSSDSD